MGKFRAFLIKILSGQQPPPRLSRKVLEMEERLESLERSHADLHAIYLKWRGYAAAAKGQLTQEAASGPDAPGGIDISPKTSTSKEALRALARKKLNRLI